MKLIDRLELAPIHMRGKDDMTLYEFFECDWCKKVCRMDYEQYRREYERDIDSHTKYRCERCYQYVENRKPGRPKKEPSETVTQSENKDNVRLQEDKQEDKPTDHLPEVSKMVESIIDHPPHYTAGTIECIDAIEAAVEGLSPQEAVLVANVLKYVWRFKRKNGKQDLQKAQWYLSRLVDKQP